MTDKFNPDSMAGRLLPALALTRASGASRPAPAAVYLLADHLDAVLAAAEDIVAAHLNWNQAQRSGHISIACEKHGVRDAIEEIRKLESTIIIRVLKSRERAEDVARDDKRFRSLVKLYTAGTAVLLDAVEECGDSTEEDFASGDAIPAYLRSRGLIDPEAAAPPVGDDIDIGEDFLIAKRIAAGPLMDLAATLLDALELHYDLFLDEDEEVLPPLADRSDSDDVATAGDGDEVEPDADMDAALADVRAASASSKEADVWANLSPRTPDAESESDTVLEDDGDGTGLSFSGVLGPVLPAEDDGVSHPDEDTTSDAQGRDTLAEADAANADATEDESDEAPTDDDVEAGISAHSDDDGDTTSDRKVSGADAAAAEEDAPDSDAADSDKPEAAARETDVEDEDGRDDTDVVDEDSIDTEIVAMAPPGRSVKADNDDAAPEPANAEPVEAEPVEDDEGTDAGDSKALAARKNTSEVAEATAEPASERSDPEIAHQADANDGEHSDQAATGDISHDDAMRHDDDGSEKKPKSLLRRLARVR